MSWDKDVAEKWPEANTDDLRRAYWEVNFMCHLLDAYENYQQMYVAPVHEAMGRFIPKVDTADEEGLSCDAKADVVSMLNALREIFSSKQYANVKMRHLYTRELQLNGSAVADLFGRMRDIVRADTEANLGVACDVCFPFLKFLEDPSTDPVGKDTMNHHVGVLGPHFNLRGLFAASKKELSSHPHLLEAIGSAKRAGILSSQRGEAKGFKEHRV
ncbi:MAG: hypothetical protein GY851_33810 [bacterium]|nr:hypothetical protein [bacterium]